MARGLWRWWTQEDGVDVWRARVEVELGQWEDVAQAAYERAGYKPTFWDLPLKEEYVAFAALDPAATTQGPSEIEQSGLLILLGIGALIFIGAVLVTIAMALFS